MIFQGMRKIDAINIAKSAITNGISRLLIEKAFVEIVGIRLTIIRAINKIKLHKTNKFKNSTLSSWKVDISGDNARIAAHGLDIPRKYVFGLAFSCWTTLSTLYLANLRAVQLAYINTITQPKPPISYNHQLYIIMAGATPKLTKSHSESSCAPKSDDDFKNRADGPSKPSITHATKTIITAISKLFSKVYLIAVIPIQSDRMVMKLGKSL